MLILITAISGSYPDIAANSNAILLKHFPLISFGIFYPTGADPTYPLILLQRLRCSPLAVVHYRPDLTNQTSWATASTLLLGWGGLALARE
jgi:hypothetical protein